MCRRRGGAAHNVISDNGWAWLSATHAVTSDGFDTTTGIDLANDSPRAATPAPKAGP